MPLESSTMPSEEALSVGRRRRTCCFSKARKRSAAKQGRNVGTNLNHTRRPAEAPLVVDSTNESQIAESRECRGGYERRVEGRGKSLKGEREVGENR
jgi:hypothetical protein